MVKPYTPIAAQLGAWLVGLHTSYGWEDPFRELISVRQLVFFLFLAVLWNFICFGLARHERSHTSFLKETLPVCVASAACGITHSLVSSLWSTRTYLLSGVQLTVWMFVSYAALLFLAWILSEHVLPMVNVPKTALVVGTGARARTLRRDMADGKRYKIIGSIDDEYLGSDQEADGYCGQLSELRFLLQRHPVEMVLIALPIASMYGKIQTVIEVCEMVGVDSSYVSDFFETNLAYRREDRRADHAHLTVLTAHRPEFRRVVKAVFDVALAALLLVALAPVFAAIAIAVKLSSPGPVFFSQIRYGLHRTRFPMFKFRTMVVDAEAGQAALEKMNEAEGPVFKIRNDPRVTRVGAFLRKLSLDELPQLLNVLRGEMSLVGPRPLPLRDVGRFKEDWLLRRFSVTPGLTCLWQAGGRNDTSFAEWIRLDLKYIDEWSLGLDFKILLMTVPAVLRGRGAS